MMISYSKCYCLFKQYIMLSSISLKTMSLPIFYIFSGSPLTSSLKRCSQWYIRLEQGPSSISCITSDNVLDNLPVGLSVIWKLELTINNIMSWAVILIYYRPLRELYSILFDQKWLHNTLWSGMTVASLRFFTFE